MVLAGLSPIESAASTCPLGTAFTPARKTSASTPEAASATGSVSIQKAGI